jgi:putative nucleotidyltransferase with HDIG domain
MLESPPTFRTLPVQTRSFLLGTVAAATGATLASALLAGSAHAPTRLLVVALALCAGTALIEALAPGRGALGLNLAAFTWAAVLLPVWAIAALAIVSFALSAWPGRSRWHLAAFDVADYALAGFAGHAVSRLAGPLHHGGVGAGAALGLLAAAATVVAVSRLLALGVPDPVRGRPPIDDGLVGLRAEVDAQQARIAHVQETYLSTITSLARMVEAKDPYTGGHTERVAGIACRLAEQLGFDEADVRAVNVGAVIHDIGKVGVPDRVLLKTGALGPVDMARMQRHPEISSDLLGELDLPDVVKQMVRSHHERFAGGGYPDGLVGEEIPLAARILAVADALDAMTSDRPYRAALSLEEALAEIDSSRGDQFCPRVVDALHTCFAKRPAAAR